MRFIILLLLLFSCRVNAQETVHRELLLMGSRFDIYVVSEDSVSSERYIDLAIAEIKRIEGIISSWDANSQTSSINDAAGIKPVVVCDELFNLIERCITISKITDGSFDISYASMDKIWKFDGSMTSLPSEEAILASVSKIGYKNIILNKEKSTVFLKNKGMKIGFGAVGKGYAADMAKDLLIAKGVLAGIINASGDMNTWGVQPDGTEWNVAITNPMSKDKAFAVLPISNKAVVTSGDYEKYITIEGKKYSHIINPKTGYPTSGIISVSVFAPKAEVADALATSIFVMGVEVGIDRINQLPDIDCIIIDDKGEIHTSKNIHINEN